METLFCSLEKDRWSKWGEKMHSIRSTAWCIPKLHFRHSQSNWVPLWHFLFAKVKYLKKKIFVSFSPQWYIFHVCQTTSSGWAKHSFCAAWSSRLRINAPIRAYKSVVLLVERFIFPVQYSNMSNRPLWGASVYPWFSDSNLSKQGMTDLEEYRCLLHSAAPISQAAKKIMVQRCCFHFNNLPALFVILY